MMKNHYTKLQFHLQHLNFHFHCESPKNRKTACSWNILLSVQNLIPESENSDFADSGDI